MKTMASIMLISVLGVVSPAAAQSTHSTAVVLSEGVSQADVDAQVRANIAARRASFGTIAEQGGCNADYLPVEIATYCFNRGDTAPSGALGAMGSNGSDGGSDSGAAE